MTKTSLLRLMVVGYVLAASPAAAQEFRSLQLIAKPLSGVSAKQIPGALPTDQIRPLDRNTVETAVRDIMKSWASGGMEDVLANNFSNRQRLLDAVARDVPQDATIRVLSVDNVRTLNQRISGKDGDADLVTSTVSAAIRTQVEYIDARLGQQRIAGNGEYLMEITLSVPRS